MRIDLDLTEEEEALVKASMQELGIDINEYVKELILEDLELMYDFNDEMNEIFLNSENDEELLEALVAQIKKMNPTISDEEAKELIAGIAEENEAFGPFGLDDFDLDEDDDDEDGDIIPFNKK